MNPNSTHLLHPLSHLPSPLTYLRFCMTPSIPFTVTCSQILIASSSRDGLLLHKKKHELMNISEGFEKASISAKNTHATSNVQRELVIAIHGIAAGLIMHIPTYSRVLHIYTHTHTYMCAHVPHIHTHSHKQID